MQQVLFNVPVLGWPIYGYGMMLFLAYFFCTWLASWLAKKEGIPSQSIYDLGIWIFICGIIGARITFMIQYRNQVDFTLWNFIALWDGGLIFYGSAIGGVVGYFGAYFFILRKQHISTWKMADIIAPCAALGLCLGRFGCLLNGCCYGGVACPDCRPINLAIAADPPFELGIDERGVPEAAVRFPLPTDPRFKLVSMGYQTAAGFTMSDAIDRVARVEPDSPAARAGLRDGDQILEIDGKRADAFTYLGSHAEWPRGKNDLVLKVKHMDGTLQDVGPFVPWTIGLQPTQLYESISMALLFLLLLAYFPYRRHAGEVMVLFMLCYAVHRFINERLRNDTDPVAFGMTLSQNISIVVFACGVLLGLWIWLRRPTADVAV
jgi:phosphatidylglycerol---prolipoprotein diacylglyceryl transferase